jgi:thiosulfate reductase cytochrome b subunit
MNEITWHESAIWLFIAQKLLFAINMLENFIKFENFQNYKIKKKKIKVNFFLNSKFS